VIWEHQGNGRWPQLEGLTGPVGAPCPLDGVRELLVVTALNGANGESANVLTHLECSPFDRLSDERGQPLVFRRERRNVVRRGDLILVPLDKATTSTEPVRLPLPVGVDFSHHGVTLRVRRAWWPVPSATEELWLYDEAGRLYQFVHDPLGLGWQLAVPIEERTRDGPAAPPTDLGGLPRALYLPAYPDGFSARLMMPLEYRWAPSAVCWHIVRETGPVEMLKPVASDRGCDVGISFGLKELAPDGATIVLTGRAVVSCRLVFGGPLPDARYWYRLVPEHLDSPLGVGALAAADPTRLAFRGPTPCVEHDVSAHWDWSAFERRRYSAVWEQPARRLTFPKPAPDREAQDYGPSTPWPPTPPAGPRADRALLEVERALPSPGAFGAQPRNFGAFGSGSLTHPAEDARRHWDDVEKGRVYVAWHRDRYGVLVRATDVVPGRWIPFTPFEGERIVCWEGLVDAAELRQFFGPDETQLTAILFVNGFTLHDEFSVAAPFGALAMIAGTTWWGALSALDGGIEDVGGVRYVRGPWLGLDRESSSWTLLQSGRLQSPALLVPIGTTTPGDRTLPILEDAGIVNGPPRLRGVLAERTGGWCTLGGGFVSNDGTRRDEVVVRLPLADEDGTRLPAGSEPVARLASIHPQGVYERDGYRAERLVGAAGLQLRVTCTKAANPTCFLLDATGTVPDAGSAATGSPSKR
jgi:hypothetical protein